jgi:hypothetical protein
MIRGVLAVIAGLAMWTLVGTVVNLVLRGTWPEYKAVEATMDFTLAMLFARLVVGALASICAGLAASWIARGKRPPVVVLAVLLFCFFIPVHYSLWERFPIWYHCTFLASLIVLPLAGAALTKRASLRASTG